jgi:hypothetical protein
MTAERRGRLRTRIKDRVEAILEDELAQFSMPREQGCFKHKTEALGVALRN